MLGGAPALVMAVNRHASCQCSFSGSTTSSANTARGWQFNSHGFAASSQHSREQLLQPEQITSADPARLCAYLVHAYERYAPHSGELDLPENLTLRFDTQAMYHEGAKLGLGSSAALTVATLGVVHQLAGQDGAELAQPEAFNIAHRAHQASQGGVGSGLDIATSLNGGVIRFQNGQSQPIHWPAQLGFVFVYAGLPASTKELVGRFNRWHNNSTPNALKQLKLAASELADGRINVDNLLHYTTALRTLDTVANIGIFSAEHLEVAQLAKRIGVVYKPCGAGGGDLGVAISDQPELLAQFQRKLRDEIRTQTTTKSTLKNRLAIIDLELAPHGLTIG